MAVTPSLLALVARKLRAEPTRVPAFLALSLAAIACTAAEPAVLAVALDTALSVAGLNAATAPEGLNGLGARVVALLGVSRVTQPEVIVAWAVACYVTLAVLGPALAYRASRIVRSAVHEVASGLRETLFDHLLSLSLAYFHRQRAGDLVARLSDDVTAVAEAIDTACRGIWESAVLLAVYGWLLFATEPRLAGALVALASLQVVAAGRAEGRLRSSRVASSRASGQLSAHVAEILRGIRVVKSFASEAWESKRWRAILPQAAEASLKHSRDADLQPLIHDTLNAVTIGAGVLLGFFSLREGYLSFQGFVLFVFVARRAVVPFSHLTRSAARLGIARGAFERLRELLAERPPLESGDLEPAPLVHSLTMEGVGFSFDGRQATLSDVSFAVPKGALVALVGRSGAGKSTVVDLLLGLLRPDTGRVLWDGVDIQRFRAASYRRRFGVVPQEASLFHSSIAANIAYASTQSGSAESSETVRRAAAVAHAQFAESLPDGLATSVGELGARLSGGQRQRIAIARALHGSPEVLVFDEATSSLDSEAERVVQAAIESAVQGATAVVIAHRLSTVQRAHRIIVLDSGGVVGIGGHAELLASCDAYRRLWEAQSLEEALQPGRSQDE